MRGKSVVEAVIVGSFELHATEAHADRVRVHVSHLKHCKNSFIAMNNAHA